MQFSNIKNLREDQDLTLSDVSSYIHTSKRNYQRYEKGELELPTGKALLLSGLYNVSVTYLLGLTGDKGCAVRQICPPCRRLKYLRRMHHLTQAQVAEKLFCRTDVYSRYETGRQETPLQMILLLSEFYHVSVDFLLGCGKPRG